ncbi:MAG: 50S ribosomal protein L15 [Nitrospirota bacterium]
MKIEDLHPAKGAKKKRKRVGRGPGSGHGKTSCKGHKGLNSRSGGSKPRGFEGGQMPLIRRIPKRGFTNIFREEYAVFNLNNLERFDADQVINPDLLQKTGLLKKGKVKVKILGDGELNKPLTIYAHKFSRVAEKKIISKGGRVEVINSRQ